MTTWDGDTTRRHQPTAWTVFGTAQAILVGDALLTLAISVLTHSGVRRGVDVLSAGLLDLCAGDPRT